MEARSRVLIVWHGALYPSYRKPFWILQTQYGWDVHLLTVPKWSQALPRRTRFEPAADEPITLHIRRAFGKLHGALFFQPAFFRIFNRVRPDVVYVIEEPYSLMGWLVTYWCKRKVPNLPVILYTYQDIQKTYPLPFRAMERYVFRHADRILVSHSKGGWVLERKGYAKMWDKLPAAVNLDRFTYKEPRYAGGLFTLGYVGRLSDEKGLDTLLWALTELSGEVRLRMAGDGPARFRLEKLARELGVYEQVAFLNAVSHEALPDFYHECDALVLPSKTRPNWQEQFGRVLVEAMACGTPVIGSDCGAIPEVIGDAGLTFPEGKPKLLADKIWTLKQDTRLQKDLSFRGRVRVEREYAAERVAKKLNQHLREVIGHARGD